MKTRSPQAPRVLARLTLPWLLAATAPLAQAVTLDQLVSGGATLDFGGLSFSHFAVEPVPLTSPQGALVNDGADIDVSAVFIDGRVGLHLLHVDPVTHAPSPLTVDLSTHGEKNFLRNISYQVTVIDAGQRIHTVAQAPGPGSSALLSVSGFIGTYVSSASGDFGPALLDEYQLVDPNLGSSGGFNSPDLPMGDVRSLGVDTAWTLTTAHGNPNSGSARIDFIDITYMLTPVPEPGAAWLALSGLAGLGWARRRCSAQAEREVA